ncbi:unnamed protein product [Staurois parvus]|uniref:Immunoglobulin V-set domain-containing protein n=1 Tax=Staurois parvus TaxID=386267 RepID=A0ABN9EHX4_9NEOB|nr:unnamed protein product [Staurois parvus]
MYGVQWIRQSEREQMEWLGAIYHEASTGYANSFKGRLTLSRDTNKREVTLKLTGMKPEESGTYYCTRYAHGIMYSNNMYTKPIYF